MIGNDLLDRTALVERRIDRQGHDAWHWVILIYQEEW